jgi:hypothetical protein
VRFPPRTPIALAAAGVLLIFFFVLVIPPRPIRLDSGAWADLASRTVSGAYHVHSTRSDGAGDKETVARAAASAGLKFVILTDHGDATRPPDPPAYVDGVLCLDAVEISTDEGHYVALDMPRSPYPLGGAAAAVVEDVARLGGFGIAAHPDSPKPSLRWTDADAPIDGLEWLNGDSEWRGDSRLRLWRAALAYPFRPGPALATLLDRPATLDRWDRLTVVRPVVGLAGLDAHGGIGRATEDGSRSNIPGVPSYRASVAAFSLHVELERPWSGDAPADARKLYAAIRAGRVYTAVDAVAVSGLLDFHAETASGQRVPMGAGLPPGTSARLVARAVKPASARIVLLHDGGELKSSTGDLGQEVTGARGAYRVEVRVPGAPGDPPVPWIVSNPIYFLPRWMPPAPPAPAGEPQPIDPNTWRIEKDTGSSAILRTASGGVELEYVLRPGGRSSQYVAIASPLNAGPITGVELTLAADRATRLSIQLRNAAGDRWERSAFVSDDPRQISVPLNSFRAIPGAPSMPPSSPASVLVVIDLTNASPGRAGTIKLSSAAAVR